MSGSSILPELGRQVPHGGCPWQVDGFTIARTESEEKAAGSVPA